MLDRDEGPVPGDGGEMASPRARGSLPADAGRGSVTTSTGRRVEPPAALPRAALGAAYPEGRAPVALSAREAEVLLWIARGASNNEIAQIVALSPHTVDTYCRRVLSKFETSSRTTAAVRAAQAGLLPRV